MRSGSQHASKRQERDSGGGGGGTDLTRSPFRGVRPGGGGRELPGPTHGGHRRLRQAIRASVTVVNTGTLKSASIVVDKFAGGNGWTFSINALAGGVPTDVALASTAVPESSIPPNSVSTVIVSFASPLPVQAGQQYALVVVRAAGQLGVGYRSGDVCPGALFESSSGGPFAPAGTGTLDAVFTVFVEPTPPDPMAATITKGPPNKTKKKTATFEFTGQRARRDVRMLARRRAPPGAASSPRHDQGKEGQAHLPGAGDGIRQGT